MNEKLSVQEALEIITVAEVHYIENHYGKAMESLTGTSLTAGVALVLERRKGQGPDGKLINWVGIDSWSMKQLNDYFAAEEIEVDPNDPESDEGKGDGLAA